MSIFKGFTLSELIELVMWELGQVSGTTVSYTHFTAAKVRQKLTQRQVDFVDKTHCLKKIAIIRAADGYNTYKLPSICMDGGLISAKFYSSATAYGDLEIVDAAYMDTAEEGYQTAGESDPQYAWMGEPIGNIPTMKVHPTCDTDGTQYASNLDTGVGTGTDLPDSMGNVTGTATGGDGTSLLDTGVAFDEMGLVAGQYVWNITDGSYSYISSIAATDITLGATLAGGTANVFAAADTYKILGGEYGVLVDWEEDTESYIFAYQPGLLANLTIPANNFLVEFVPFPIAFPSSDSDDVYPEIPKLYHHALAMGVVADFLRSFHEKTKEFQRATAYEQEFQASVQRATTKKESRPFKTKPTRIRPRYS